MSFTGKSYINANNGKALTIDNVNADVTLNSADAVTNSRAAFVSLGASEMNDKPLLVKIMNSNIVVVGNNNPDPVLGWRYIADGSLIRGNTFGAEGKGNIDSFKFMNFMNNATITVKNNTAYVKGNGFTFGQNNSRANMYNAIVEGNTFIGNADYIWVEMSGSTNPIQGNIIANNNMVGNSEFQVTDIKTNNQKVNSAVINLEKDAQGKIIGGVYSSLTVSEYIEYVRENLADGYTLTENSNGSYTVTSI